MGNGQSTPLHVSVDQPKVEVGGVNILPAIAAVMRILPDSTRINMLAKQSAPKVEKPADWYDWFGETPYEIGEVVEGKVWRVKYSIENIFAFGPEEERKMMGLDFENKASAEKVIQAAELHGNKDLSAQVLKDLKRAAEIAQLVKEKGKTKETVETVGPFKNNMVVVKLNNGDVMLYSPVQVRDEFGFSSWIESIGPVKWIVLGSSAHTLQLPNILKRFPDASYVSSKDAWLKLQKFPEGISKDTADYEYTDPTQLKKLNKLLENEGVEFHYVDGDIASHALIAVAHKTALEVDIIYSSCAGGFMGLSEKQFWKLEEKDIDARLFKLGLASSPNSPNNALPPYRFWMMDPACAFSAMCMSSPLKHDGSSCTDMANSLRTVIKQDFDHAVGVHFDYMTGDDFRKSIDMNWGWLDGNSLLTIN